MRPEARLLLGLRVALLALLPALALAEPAPELDFHATVVVKGDVLHGELRSMDSQGVLFSTPYGKGEILIPWKNIDHVETDRVHYIEYGEGRELRGHVLGVDDEEVLFGVSVATPVAEVPEGDPAAESAETATKPGAPGETEPAETEPTAAPEAPPQSDAPEAPETFEELQRIERIPFAEIRATRPAAEFDASLLTRLRTRYRHWDAELGVAIEFEEGAVDKEKVNVSGFLSRRRKPTRWTANAFYAYETQQERGRDKRTTKNEGWGRTKLEYDVRLIERLERSYVAALFLGEYDEPRNVLRRLAPAGGVGYRIFDTDRHLMAVNLGIGGVFSEFKNVEDSGDGEKNQTNNFFSGLIEIEWRYKFWRDMEAWLEFFYLPKFTKPADDWLLRTSLGMRVPIWDPIALRWTIVQINDNNPSEQTGNNKLVTTVGLALYW